MADHAVNSVGIFSNEAAGDMVDAMVIFSNPSVVVDVILQISIVCCWL